jgi:hypothetical protein
MDSHQLRKMSMRNAAMAVKQAQRMGWYDTEVKLLKISNPEKLNTDTITYIGRSLLDGRDNYSWEVKRDEGMWRITLYRDWIDEENTTFYRCRVEDIKESLIREVWVDRGLVTNKDLFSGWIEDNTIRYDKIK